MADTPRHYIQILDLITDRKEPSVKELGVLVAYQFRMLRKIFADKNMVGIGVCEKVINKRNTGRLVVCFYVEKKIAISKLSARKLIPPVIAAPNGQAVFTDVQQIGRLQAQVNVQSTPILSGYSVGHKNTGSGTLGAIVSKAGARYILSNSHVLAKSGTASLGDVILYPGKSDGGVVGTDDVATLSQFKPFTLGGGFVNHCDAAIAKVLTARLNELDPAIPGVTSPGFMAPAVGMTVMLMGRSSGARQGVIKDANFRGLVKFVEFPSEVGFTEQVMCDRFTKNGDSGAIVVDKATGMIVGLHFSGSGNTSVFTPIQKVISALGFQFIDPRME